MSDDCYSSPQQVICNWMKITKLVTFSACVAGGIVMPGVLSCCLVEAPGRSLEGNPNLLAKKLEHSPATWTIEFFIV